MTGIIFTQPYSTKDETAPYVINVETTGSGFITNNQIGVSTLPGAIWLYFSEPIQPGRGNVTLREAKLTGNITIFANATTLDTTSYGYSIAAMYSVPTLIDGQKYYIQIDEGVLKDRADNNVHVTNSFSFTTAYDTTKPTIISSSPYNGETGVDRNANVVIELSEPVQDGNGGWYLLNSVGGTQQSWLNVSTDPNYTGTSNYKLYPTTTITFNTLTIPTGLPAFSTFTLTWTANAVQDFATRARAPAYNGIAASNSTTQIVFTTGA